MGKLVVRTTRVKLGAVGYEAQIKAATLSAKATELEASNLESDGWKEVEVGLRNATLTLDLVKDADLSGLDAAMWTAFESGADVALEMLPADAAVSTTNPKWTGAIKIMEWSPISGGVGQLAGGSISFPVNGKLTRATS